MTKNNARPSKPDARVRESDLDSRYGEIGISAVAAALPYRSEAKDPVDATADKRLEKLIAELTA
jgi:hypothetical protein